MIAYVIKINIINGSLLNASALRLNSLLIVSTQVLQDLEEVDLGPGGGESVVVETVM